MTIARTRRIGAASAFALALAGLLSGPVQADVAAQTVAVPPAPALDLAGKVAIVTGASRARGLGAAIARRLGNRCIALAERSTDLGVQPHGGGHAQHPPHTTTSRAPAAVSLNTVTSGRHQYCTRCPFATNQ